jgi:hypothetical protein
MKRLLAGILLLSFAVPGYPAEWKLLETRPDGMRLYMKQGTCDGTVCQSDIWIRGKNDKQAEGVYAYPQIDCRKGVYRDSRPAEGYSGTVKQFYPATDWVTVREQSAVMKVMQTLCPQKP